MKQIAQFRIFAGHYQFILCDYEADPLELSNWTPRAHKRGFQANRTSAFITSRADLNDIVVKIELSAKPPSTKSVDRALAFKLFIPSGQLLVSSLDEYESSSKRVKIPAGSYQVNVLSYNLGVDGSSTGELRKPDWKRLSDRARFARKDYEYHRVVLVPVMRRMRSDDAN